MGVIKGLCSVNGNWMAEYEGGVKQVVCWAMVSVMVEEYPDGLNDWKKEVHGMVVGKDGKLVDAESLEGFKGYGQP